MTKMIVIAGPCQIESQDHCLFMAEKLQEISEQLDIEIIFKASFDKANRTSGTSARGVGMELALKTFHRIKADFGMRILTDVHEPWQCKEVASVVDVLQIPALLSRQTDLIRAASTAVGTVNIKKGQFMSPQDMHYAKNKVVNGCTPWLTERGTMLGYGDLVVDMRSIPIMKGFATTIFDCTHSVQTPNSEGGSTGGNRRMSETLARAAIAAGADGLFIETHNDPNNALSDGPVMMPLSQFESFLDRMIELHGVIRELDRGASGDK